MKWVKINVHLGRGNFYFYSAIPVEVGDQISVETKNGVSLGHVNSIMETVTKNPFKVNGAKCHVLENITKRIFKEEFKMATVKVVEVKHISSKRTQLCYAPKGALYGDIVVYEAPGFKDIEDQVQPRFAQRPDNLHVGTIINDDIAATVATGWVVDKVDFTNYYDTKNAVEALAKLRIKLDEKKKQFQDLELLRLIAASDPETKALLDQFVALTTGGATNE